MDRYLPLALMLAVVPGFVAGRRRDLRDAAARIFRLIYRLSLPCTPFVLAAAPLRESALAVLAVWTVSTIVLVLGATYARLRFAREDERAAFTLSAYWSNTGWLGLAGLRRAARHRGRPGGRACMRMHSRRPT